jgi:hypothetical protein
MNTVPFGMLIFQYTLYHDHFLWSVWTTGHLFLAVSISFQ